jgi:hypothetical protein
MNMPNDLVKAWSDCDPIISGAYEAYVTIRGLFMLADVHSIEFVTHRPLDQERGGVTPKWSRQRHSPPTCFGRSKIVLTRPQVL